MTLTSIPLSPRIPGQMNDRRLLTTVPMPSRLYGKEVKNHGRDDARVQSLKDDMDLSSSLLFIYFYCKKKSTVVYFILHQKVVQ